MVHLKGHVVTGLVESDILYGSLGEILSFLWLLKSNATKESSVYNKLAQEITLAGLLYKYTRNTAYRKGGMTGKDWITGFVRKNANLSLKQ
jgi:hypothetical protein